MSSTSLRNIASEAASSGSDCHLVLDEVAQVGILFLADRRLEGDRLLRDLLQLLDLVDRDPHAVGEFLFVRLASELLQQGTRDARQLVEGVDHVDRDADGPRLVSDGAGDRLADPPGGVGRELKTALVIELLDGAHQPQVAFLDQVEEGKPTVQVLLGDRNHQPEVRLGQVVARLFRAGLHLLGKLNLLLGGQQVDSADLLEVHPDRVVEGNRADHLDLGQLLLIVRILLRFAVGGNLDAHLLEGSGNSHEAIRIPLNRGKRLHHIIGRQEALVFPFEDQRFRAQHQRVDLNPRLYLCHEVFLTPMLTDSDMIRPASICM